MTAPDIVMKRIAELNQLLTDLGLDPLEAPPITLAFSACVDMLGRLHELIEEGKGDDEEADALRDQMCSPYAGLTDEQEDYLRLISVAMYRKAEKSK